jgi:alpha-glucosidase
MYYGEELGMVTSTPTRKEDVKDPIGITGWPKEKGRDGERTPMQWDAGLNAGFSTAAKTWLPVAADYKTVNVKVEAAEPHSLLKWNEELIALRRKNAALRDGSMAMLDETNPSVLSFIRKGPSGSVVVVVNCTGSEQTVSLDVPGSVTTLLTDSAGLETGVSLKKMVVPAFASWVGELK